MTAPNRGWRPVPECTGCSRPIRRNLARSNGGYCTTCRPRGSSPVQALAEDRQRLHEWQQLARERGQAARRAADERARQRIDALARRRGR